MASEALVLEVRLLPARSMAGAPWLMTLMYVSASQVLLLNIHRMNTLISSHNMYTVNKQVRWELIRVAYYRVL